MTLKCANCGSMNRDGLDNCGSCGAQLSDAKRVDEGGPGVSKIWDRKYPSNDASGQWMTCDPLNIDESLASIARSVNGIYSLMLLTFIMSIFILGVMVLWQIA